MKTHQHGIIHAYAQCQSCDWTEAIDITKPNWMQTLRNEITKHVKNTKHSVVLETGNSTIYSP